MTRGLAMPLAVVVRSKSTVMDLLRCWNSSRIFSISGSRASSQACKSTSLTGPLDAAGAASPVPGAPHAASAPPAAVVASAAIPPRYRRLVIMGLPFY